MSSRARRDKRGLSIIIGYVLLIAISIVMSVLVYAWLKTYIPKEAPQCSEGSSVFIKDIFYDCANQQLNITLKNNGKFGINGYFIHASNKSGEELATIDLSPKIIGGGEVYGNSIAFMLVEENFLSPDEPNNIITSSFNTAGYGTLYKIEIIPTRLEEIDKKKRLVSCSNAKIEEDLTCS
jgi:hypothetical protein